VIDLIQIAIALSGGWLCIELFFLGIAVFIGEFDD